MIGETRARRRIRQAVESRGYRVESIDYEPWYNAGEMMGIAGGWWIELDRPYVEHTFPGNDLQGLSVEEVIAQVDYWLKPAGPCGCDRNHDPLTACRLINDPCKPTHDPGCPHHLKYHLPWWPAAGEEA
ncbi:hypothetical protein PBI_MANDA_41 [Mycobacterium phage Manda]|nr:hypothetical protein PBI_MANDA_41 [Mycobacterium phage Manda]